MADNKKLPRVGYTTADKKRTCRLRGIDGVSSSLCSGDEINSDIEQLYAAGCVCARNGHKEYKRKWSGAYK
jgi:hypothetical protein